MGEAPEFLAAPVIFIFITILQFLSVYLEYTKKRGSMNDFDNQLREEIKQLIKEANSLSQPSTFAQAAKLRRVAAAKEKELARNLELYNKNKQVSIDSYMKVLKILKGFTYLMLICWFWRVPVATISKQLVQPFGKVLSWRAGDNLSDNVMVGIIPWLILTSRVSRYIVQRIFK